MTANVHQIEDIVVEILFCRGRRETRYYVPQGMNGDKFSSFKIRNKIKLDLLKTTKYEKEEKPKSKPSDGLSFKPESFEGLSDYPIIQGSTVN